MRERRSNLQLVRDMIRHLYEHGNLSLSELAGLLGTNTIVVSRWLDIIEFVQLSEQVSRGNDGVAIRPKSITVTILSSRRRSKIKGEFEIFSGVSPAEMEFFNSVFKVGEDGDLLIIDSEFSSDHNLKRFHLTTQFNGKLPISHWELLKLMSTYNDVKSNLSLLPVLNMSEHPQLGMYIFDQSIDVSALEGISSQYSPEDPRFWSNLTTDQCRLLIQDEHWAVIIYRINFLSNRLEIFPGEEGGKLPPEALFWKYLVLLDHNVNVQMTMNRLVHLLRSMDDYFGKLAYLFITERTNLTVDMDEVIGKGGNPDSIWLKVLSIFANSVYLHVDPVRILGTYAGLYLSLDKRRFPFMSYWLLLQIEHQVQKLCFPHSQTSWLNALSESTLFTMGYGTRHMRVSGHLVKGAFKTRNFKSVSLLTKMLADRYDILEHYLFGDDLKLFNLFSTLNATSISARKGSQYKFEMLLDFLFKDKSPVFHDDPPNRSAIEWILSPHERKRVELILDIVVGIFGKDTDMTARKVMSSDLHSPLKKLLLLLWIGLPEFRYSPHKFAFPLEEIGTLTEDSDVLSDLILLRFLLIQGGKSPLQFRGRVERRMIKRLDSIRKHDGAIEDVFNLEFVFSMVTLTSQISKEDGWNKPNLLRKIKLLDYRKNLKKEPFTSPNALYNIYQRMIPRKGRKSQSLHQFFADVTTDLSSQDIHSLLLVREILVKALE